MNRVLVVDACSILDFLKYYIFDKNNGKEVYRTLTEFLLKKIQKKEIIILDKVYDEINENFYTKDFREAVKPYIVDSLFLFDKINDLIDNNYRKEIEDMFNYDQVEIDKILDRYEEKHADLYLIAYCKYLKEQKMKPILITEETFGDDKKLIEKIPTICKKEKIEFRKVPYSLFEIYKDELKFDLEVELI